MTLARAQNAESTRLEALRMRHAAISREIDEERKHPAASDFAVRRLKSEKLKIKDQMADYSQTS